MIREKLSSLNNAAICFVNKWWRLWAYLIFVGAIATDTIVIPYMTRTPPPLKDLAVLLLGFAPLAGLKTYEKLQDPHDPLGSVTKPLDDPDK